MVQILSPSKKSFLRNPMRTMKQKKIMTKNKREKDGPDFLLILVLQLSRISRIEILPLLKLQNIIKSTENTE